MSSSRKIISGGLESLPATILVSEILLKLDLETLCSLSCLNRAFRLLVNQALLLLPSSLDLSPFTPDAQTLSHIVSRRRRGLESITLNCLRLEESSVIDLLGPSVRELNLLSCSLLPYQILACIGDRCPNLRVLVVEFTDRDSAGVFNENLNQMLRGCLHLESLCLKIRWTEMNATFFQSIEFFLPISVRTLKLKPMLEQHALPLVNGLTARRKFMETTNLSNSPLSSAFTLRCLSLVVDFISDELIIAITKSFPSLVVLDLEDRPKKEPLQYQDLTNIGLQSLCACCHLTSLSLIRSRQNHPTSFKRINDMGIFLLSEGCKSLESLRLCGFSKVTDAGFASILHSCKNLKKFEVRNAMLLSDLAFHDLTEAPCSLVEVRLLSCCLITSETVNRLVCSRSLEVLDFSGCRSIVDSCLHPISRLCKLTSVNLAEADVTNDGLSCLSEGSSPITHLCLRGCKRVTDKGIICILHGRMSKTLSTLDLGHMPGISDKAILAISVAGKEISELCIRNCFFVTDSSIQALATKSELKDGRKGIRKLDLYNCTGLSVKSLDYLQTSSFRGLRWLGIGHTHLSSKGIDVLEEICSERQWITICLDGCEMDCHDGWQFHNTKHRS